LGAHCYYNSLIHTEIPTVLNIDHYLGAYCYYNSLIYTEIHVLSIVSVEMPTLEKMANSWLLQENVFLFELKLTQIKHIPYVYSHNKSKKENI